MRHSLLIYVIVIPSFSRRIAPCLSTDPPRDSEAVYENLVTRLVIGMLVVVVRGIFFTPRYRVLEVRLLPSAHTMRCCI